MEALQLFTRRRWNLNSDYWDFLLSTGLWKLCLSLLLIMSIPFYFILVMLWHQLICYACTGVIRKLFFASLCKPFVGSKLYYGLIPSPFCTGSCLLRMLLMNPLLFPGPKLEACMSCFQRSKDDVGLCHLSLGLNNGARTASNFLHKTIDDQRMASIFHLIQWYSSFQVCWEPWTHMVPM